MCSKEITFKGFVLGNNCYVATVHYSYIYGSCLCKYVCVYMCMYVYVYAWMYVCVYVENVCVCLKAEAPTSNFSLPHSSHSLSLSLPLPLLKFSHPPTFSPQPPTSVSIHFCIPPLRLSFPPLLRLGLLPLHLVVEVQQQLHYIFTFANLPTSTSRAFPARSDYKYYNSWLRNDYGRFCIYRSSGLDTHGLKW